MEDFEKLNKLIETKFRLLAIETQHRDDMLTGFRKLSRYINEPVYVWENGKGLFRLEAPHIIIPNTKTAVQVLKHINQSKHAGIYLLSHINEAIQDEGTHQWIRSITSNNTIHKVLVLMDTYLDMPPALSSFALRTNYISSSKVA